MREIRERQHQEEEAHSTVACSLLTPWAVAPQRLPLVRSQNMSADLLFLLASGFSSRSLSPSCSEWFRVGEQAQGLIIDQVRNVSRDDGMDCDTLVL